MTRFPIGQFSPPTLGKTQSDLTLNLNIGIIFAKNEYWDRNKARYKELLKKNIEANWNNHPFQIEIRFKTNADRKYKNVRVIPKLKLNLIEYSFSEFPRGELPDTAKTYKFRNGAWKGKNIDFQFWVGVTNQAYASHERNGRRAYLRAGDQINQGQIAGAHELGHLLGIMHPGQMWQEKIKRPITAEGYDQDPNALMGKGGQMRGYYYQRWLNQMNKEFTLSRGNEWIIAYNYKRDKLGTTIRIGEDGGTYKGWQFLPGYWGRAFPFSKLDLELMHRKELRLSDRIYLPGRQPDELLPRR